VIEEAEEWQPVADEDRGPSDGDLIDEVGAQELLDDLASVDVDLVGPARVTGAGRSDKSAPWAAVRASGNRQPEGALNECGNPVPGSGVPVGRSRRMLCLIRLPYGVSETA